MTFDFVVDARQVHRGSDRARRTRALAALDPAVAQELGEGLLQEPQWLEQPMGIRHTETGKVITNDRIVLFSVFVGQQCPFEVGQFEKADETERTVTRIDVCFLHEKDTPWPVR
ncbi:hypothetical protein BSG18_49870 [Pseudomonas ogarae]|nr:hypothetical protein BSG18_49870 [Pseudomonas ogarae]